MVGSLDERIDGVARTYGGNAHAEGDRDLLTPHRDAAGAVGGPQTEGLGKIERGVQLGVRQEQGELIPAVAADEIPFPHPLLEPATHLGQHAIARLVAVRIVDPFEAVQVDQHQGERLALALTVGDRQVQLFVQRFAIGHGGQPVGSGFAPGVVDLLGLLLHLVAVVGEILLEPLVRVQQRPHVLQQRLLDGLHFAVGVDLSDVVGRLLNLGVVGLDLAGHPFGRAQQLDQHFERGLALPLDEILFLVPGGNGAAEVEPGHHPNTDTAEHPRCNIRQGVHWCARLLMPEYAQE